VFVSAAAEGSKGLRRVCVAMAVSFGVPQVAENLDGWGPDASSVPSQLEHVPYAPFSKGDRVGRASDWTGQAFKYNQGIDCDFLLVLKTLAWWQ